MNYRPEIDGLRAIAVIPVILFHAGFAAFNGGFIGVDVFFVISGFLITNIIINELNSDSFSLVNFYERRARRILPALMMVMLICIPFTLIWFVPGDMENFSKSLLSASLFYSNYQFWFESGYFETASELKPLIHTWSLSIEEQFYIFFPLLLILIWKIRINYIFILILIFFSLSFFLAQWGAYNHPTATFWLLPTRMWELLLGVIISLYLFNKKFNPSKQQSQIFSLVGLCLILISTFYFDKTIPNPSVYTLLPTVGTALLILYARPGTLLNVALSNKILVKMGLISYSLYLFHQPIFAFLKYRFGIEVLNELITPILILLIFIAYLNWKFVEKPFRDQSLFTRSQIFTFSLISIFCMTSFGLVGIFTNGFEQRFGNYERKVLAQYTNPGDYVNSRFSDYYVNFDEDENTTNVMIIGDSFAEDIVNVIFESKLNRFLSVSTKKIQSHCGNLFTKKDLKKYILPQKILSCENNYSDPIFISRLDDADEIWLISSWKEWMLPMIPESVENFKKNFPNANIKIFGRKSFGRRNVNEFIGSVKSGIDVLLSTKPLPEEHILVNDHMKRIVSTNEFIDVSMMLCNSRTECSNSNDDGLPISYDGIHFTRAGAKYFGDILRKTEYIQSLNRES
tara:strand:+ start:3421 stop:5301 length:1881 start_codon:yes stop_codon:yes gene_type:complete